MYPHGEEDKIRYVPELRDIVLLARSDNDDVSGRESESEGQAMFNARTTKRCEDSRGS